VVGGALAVGGTLLFILAPSPSKPREVLSVAPMVLPGGAYLSVSGVVF
jgi:hypothetical protein